MIVRSTVICLVLATATLLLFPDTARAHPEGFSGLHISLNGHSISAAMTLHTRDLGFWFPPGKYPDYVPSVCRELERSVNGIVELQLESTPISPTEIDAHLVEVGLIELDVTWKLPRITEPSELLIWSKHLPLMPRGHQQLLFIENRHGLMKKDELGKLLLEDVLTAEHDAAAVSLTKDAAKDLADPMPVASPEMTTIVEQPPPGEDQAVRVPLRSPSGQAPRKISFFLLGVEHILTGYDHLLFLAALLLTCVSLAEAAEIITCFTLAHSITLALAALDIVQLSPGLVEPVIAMSIVCVALENLWTTTPPLWRRVVITFGFGLIHGLGFASVLREVGLGTIPGGVVWPLLRFNLGVEAGQLCVATVFFLMVRYARRTESFHKKFIRGGSLLIALCGGYWMVTRILAEVSFR